MEEEIKKEKCKCSCNGNAAGGGVYGLALIGALIYYLQHAQNATEIILGILKALVWPAILIYKLLELLAK